MRKALTVVLIAVLMLTVAACETVDPQAFEKFTLVETGGFGSGIYVRLETRPGVTQTFVGSIPPDAKAVFLWFPGGEGIGGNMELDSVLVPHGIGFVNVPPPSDWPRGFVCCDRPFRSSTHHLRDVAAVIGYLRKERGLPIWLGGVSMGTVSIATVATRLPEAIDGVVFLSAITAFAARRTRARGETLVTEMRLSKIEVPVLAIAHAQDSDPTTPPDGAESIVRYATNAPVKEAKIFSAGPGVTPHEGFHTFIGSREEVAVYVAKFILPNLRRRPPS